MRVARIIERLQNARIQRASTPRVVCLASPGELEVSIRRNDNQRPDLGSASWLSAKMRSTFSPVNPAPHGRENYLSVRCCLVLLLVAAVSMGDGLDNSVDIFHRCSRTRGTFYSGDEFFRFGRRGGDRVCSLELLYVAHSASKLFASPLVLGKQHDISALGMYKANDPGGDHGR